jgi:mono/diheme cytochrome c family protein
MIEFAGLLALVVAAGLFTCCGIAAWRMRRRVVAWAGASLMGCLAAIAAGASLLAILGLIRLDDRDAPLPHATIAATPSRIARGRAIADSYCGGCHAPEGPLSGGLELAGHLPLPIGSFVSSNLTPIGLLSGWSDGEIFRAIRNAVDAHGRWLIIMSYTNAGRLSDDDIDAVIAYLRSLAPAGVETRNPPDRLNLLGLVMLGAGLLPGGNPVLTGVVGAPPKAPTAAYGAYVLSYQDCRVCHGADLRGGVKGQLAPIGPDLDIVAGWTLGQFIATLRTGVDPQGHAIGPEMPWRQIGKLDDDELSAVYQYLTRRPATATSLSRNGSTDR